MKRSLSFLIFITLFLISLGTNAQVTQFDSTATYSIETTDGNSYQGKILQVDKDQVRIATNSIGEISIPQHKIQNFKTITENDIRDGVYWYPSPYATRYFFGPNAYGLKNGEGYYQNTWVFMNQVSYGFSENFTMGIGTIPLFLFGSTEGTPFWITPKVTIPVTENKVNLMAGGFIGTAIGADGAFGGILYTGASFGSRDNNGTIGFGWGFFDGTVAQRPTISFSYMKRVSKKFYFLTENYLINAGFDRLGIVSAGGRLAYEPIAIDFGLFRPAFVDAGLLAFPWLGVHVPFGKR